jgi:thymidylate kinase
MQYIILFDGMTWSGKSTTALLLKKLLPRTAIIGMDKVKRFITDFERGERDNTIAKNIVYSMTQTYLSHDISLLIEQPCKNIDEINMYTNLAKEKNIPIILIQLYSDPVVALQRVRERQKDRDYKVPDDRIQHNIELFSDRSEQWFTVIDTTNMPPEEVADRVLHEITIKTTP